MKILEDQERTGYQELEEKVACTIFKESTKEIANLNGVEEKKEIIKDDAVILGDIIGKRVLDKVNELTENMSREEIVRQFAHVLAMHTTFTMNESPLYFGKIVMMSEKEEQI